MVHPRRKSEGPILKLLAFLRSLFPPRRGYSAGERRKDRTEPTDERPRKLIGKCWVIDGDTIVIDRVHIRLFGIDAPELDHPWGKASKSAMIRLCRGQTITAVLEASTSHERVVAKCYLADGTDLSAALVKQGLALDWPKYSGGAYTQFEQTGVRRKLWRAAARQRGRMPSA